MGILTIEIEYAGYITDELMASALPGSGCFIIKKIEHNFLIGAEDAISFYELGRHLQALLD